MRPENLGAKSEIKSEIIQQFTADLITRGQTSGKAISKELKERCNLSIPERTIRHHVTNMGLSGIKESLPKLVSSIKKLQKLVDALQDKLPCLNDKENNATLQKRRTMIMLNMAKFTNQEITERIKCP